LHLTNGEIKTNQLK